MDRTPARVLLYAVGSLPFWTGQRKLVQFLSGQPGSFWSDPPPLKPIYLEHRFFGALEDQSESSIRSELERLKHHHYLVQEQLSKDLPHRVVKFTHQGARKYYNLLVVEHGQQDPLWRLQHLSRLTEPLAGPVSTAGQLIEFSGRTYLSQTPEFVEPEGRVQDEATLPFKPESQSIQPGKAYVVNNLHHDPDKNRLVPGDNTEIQPLSGGDLSRLLTHFPNEQQTRDQENPYVLRGSLANDPDRQTARVHLVLTDNDGDQLSVVLSPGDLPDELPLESNRDYVLGPVEAHPDTPDVEPKPVLRLQSSAEIKAAQNPF